MRYEKYKETGEKWLQLIPESWEISRLKSLFSFGKGLPITKADLTESGVPVISYGQVHSKTNSGTGLSVSLFRFVPDSFLSTNSHSLVKKGDFIFADTSEDKGGCGNCVYIDRDILLFAGYHSIILKSTKTSDNKYLAYLFLTDHWRYQIRSKVDGVKVYSVSKPILSSTTVVLPPREEQDQIVRYLDWQTSRINKLIHGYQRETKLLEERKNTVIDSAVTKGIRPNRDMQQTPTNWMGDIPIDWKLIPSKRLFTEGKERKRLEDKPATASQKYGIIAQEDYMRKEGKRIVIATQGLDDWKHVDPDNFVISLRSFQGGIERSAISGCVTWHYIVLIPQAGVIPQYFKWLLKSKSYIKALQGTSEFIRDGQDLRYSNFAKVDLPLVPEDEQIEIAQYIESEVEKIDKAIPVIQKEIDLLREYRTRLISDVVTGQIDVRGIAIPEYEPENDSDEPEAVEDEEAEE